MARNYPNQQISGLEEHPEKIQGLITSLEQLYRLGKPKTNEELRERIDNYFTFCASSAVRPSVESLALACGVTRQTLYYWKKGEKGADAEKQEIIEHALSLIHTFLEQCILSGAINPPAGIFLAKNWMGYRDVISFEDATALEPEKPKKPKKIEEIGADFRKYVLEQEKKKAEKEEERKRRAESYRKDKLSYNDEEEQ